MTPIPHADPFRPFVWLAAAAFILGFAGYLAVGMARLGQTQEQSFVAADPAVVMISTGG